MKFFRQIGKRLCLLGLAAITARAGWFFLTICFRITDTYDVSTADDHHIDFFKAIPHLLPLMGSCFAGIALMWVAFFLIKSAVSK